ncbi:MAG: c-type cytochrome [Sideroxydans sp.]|nr:c-type cytochrome [Sideroxydans sp.]
MKAIVTGFAVAGLLFAGSAMAADMPKEGKAKCGACHAVEKKVVGPAFKDVAAKYAGKADAEKTLIANITKGGAFGWKNGNMPPKGAGAKPEEIELMAKYILTLK